MSEWPNTKPTPRLRFNVLNVMDFFGFHSELRRANWIKSIKPISIKHIWLVSATHKDTNTHTLFIFDVHCETIFIECCGKQHKNGGFDKNYFRSTRVGK
jgi:hypothetical protein